MLLIILWLLSYRRKRSRRFINYFHPHSANPQSEVVVVVVYEQDFYSTFSNDVDIDLLSLTPRKMEKIPATCPPGIIGERWGACVYLCMLEKGLKNGIQSCRHTFRCTFELRVEREKTSSLFKQWKETFNPNVCRKKWVERQSERKGRRISQTLQQLPVFLFSVFVVPSKHF